MLSERAAARTRETPAVSAPHPDGTPAAFRPKHVVAAARDQGSSPSPGRHLTIP